MNLDIAKEFGHMQYGLLVLILKDCSDDEKKILLQRYWDEFKTILKVAETHSEIMYSKYMTMMFAYQELFNFKGGETPRLDGIDINSDTKEMEKKIIKYLGDRERKR